MSYNSLPSTYTSSICSICLSEINDSISIFKTYCDHCFHIDCIFPWISDNTTCPNCRQPITFNNEILDDRIYNFYDHDEIHEDLAYSFMFRDIIILINNINTRINNYTNSNNSITYARTQINNILNNISNNNSHHIIDNHIIDNHIIDNHIINDHIID